MTEVWYLNWNGGRPRCVWCQWDFRIFLCGGRKQVLAELIADDVRKALLSRRKAAGQAPPELLAQYVASTFVLVLNWWVESNSALRPKDVDGVFRALTVPTLSTYLD